MGHIRLVEDVAIVDWDPSRLPEVVGELRSHIDQHHGRKVALNLVRAELRADDMETLAEAASVCRDRGCPVGLFALGDDLARFLDVVGLAPDLPPVLGTREDEAVAAIKRDGVGLRPAGRSAPPPPPAPVPSPEVELTGAVTERFDPISDVEAVGPPAAMKAAAPVAAAAGEQPVEELLAINWADLTRTGYEIGGPGGDKIQAEAVRGAPTPKRAAPPEDDVIDLDEPTRGQGRKRDRVQKTEVLPAFKVEEQPPSGEWTAKPAAAGITGLRDEETRIGPEDYSPVDSSSSPPAFLSQTVEPVSRSAPTPPPTKRQAPKPGQAAAPPPRSTSPPPRTPPLGEAPAASPTPYYEADDGDEQTVMFQATVPIPTAGGLPGPHAPGVSDSSEQFTDSDDQVVMFQPGAQDLALLAQISAQVSPPEPVSPSRAVPAAPAGRQPAPPPEDDDGELSQDETIMFQPGALDAALLAEVAAAAGPETHIPPPAVAEPPEPELPPLQLPDGRDLELRLFVHDYAIVTETHLSLLDRFIRAGEETLAPQELQPADGRQNGDRTPPQALAGIVDQFVHSKLVRRTRSPRARGGTGFVFSPSPQVRGVVVRLVKLWQSSRPKVMGWLSEGKKA